MLDSKGNLLPKNLRKPLICSGNTFGTYGIRSKKYGTTYYPWTKRIGKIHQTNLEHLRTLWKQIYPWLPLPQYGAWEQRACVYNELEHYVLRNNIGYTWGLDEASISQISPLLGCIVLRSEDVEILPGSSEPSEEDMERARKTLQDCLARLNSTGAGS